MDEIPECDSCGYQTNELKEFRDWKMETTRLCEFCANTHAASEYHDLDHVMQAIAWSHNRIMDEIRKMNHASERVDK